MSEYIIRLNEKNEPWHYAERQNIYFFGYPITGEIVRCRDCKHFDPHTGSCARRDYVAPMAVEAYDFCSRGERE